MIWFALHIAMVVALVLWSAWLLIRGHYWPASIIAVLALLKALP